LGFFLTHDKKLLTPYETAFKLNDKWGLPERETALSNAYFDAWNELIRTTSACLIVRARQVAVIGIANWN
jgi:hypothetical protein